VSAYVGSSKNLKDLKRDLKDLKGRGLRQGERVGGERERVAAIAGNCAAQVDAGNLLARGEVQRDARRAPHLERSGERMLYLAFLVRGLSTEQFPVSAYIGCSKNLKDLKGGRRGPVSTRNTWFEV